MDRAVRGESALRQKHLFSRVTLSVLPRKRFWCRNNYLSAWLGLLELRSGVYFGKILVNFTKILPNWSSDLSKSVGTQKFLIVHRRPPREITGKQNLGTNANSIL